MERNMNVLPWQLCKQLKNRCSRESHYEYSILTRRHFNKSRGVPEGKAGVCVHIGWEKHPNL